MKHNRRELLKWTSPVVLSINLPAHALMSWEDGEKQLEYCEEVIGEGNCKELEELTILQG